MAALTGRKLPTKKEPTLLTDLNDRADVTAVRKAMTKEVRKDGQRAGHMYHEDFKWENLLEA